MFGTDGSGGAAPYAASAPPTDDFIDDRDILDWIIADRTVETDRQAGLTARAKVFPDF